MAGIWILKAIIQKGISFFPFKHKINYYFQKFVTRGLVLTEALFEDKLAHCSNHIQSFRHNHPEAQSFNVFELGTGWYPIVPVGLFLCGAREVISVDLSPLMNKKQVVRTMEFYLKYFRANRLHRLLPGIRANRMKVLENTILNSGELEFAEILRALNLKVVIGDASNLSFIESQSIDLITSNNTFEHIYADALTNICKEMKRVIKPTGIMSHFIDLSDHYAHLDSSITVFNFLKFSTWQWNIIDNSVQPMNRLRIPEYRRIFHQAGFIILKEENKAWHWSDIQEIKLDRKFKDMVLEDLLVSHAHLVLKPKSGKLKVEKEEMLKQLESLTLN